MRIVCLITAGAFLMSISMADGDVPMGATQYHQRVVHRPIILEPVKKHNSNQASPLNWFFNMFTRIMEPPRVPAHQPKMIGPINLPGVGNQVYIKEVPNAMPWESNHIVIRLVARDPVTGFTVPMETSGTPPHNRGLLEDPSRRVVKPLNYQSTTNNINNHSPVRPNNMIMQHQQILSSSPSVTPAYSSWSGQQRQRLQQPQQYSSSYLNKPLRASSPNDLRFTNYGKEIDQSSFTKGNIEDNNNNNNNFRRPYQNNNYQNFQSNPGMTNSQTALSGTGSSIGSPSIYRHQSIIQQQNNGGIRDYSNHNYHNHQQFSKEMMQNSNRNGNNYYNMKESSRTTQMPMMYPQYPPLRDNTPRFSVPRKMINETLIIGNNSVSTFRDADGFRPVVRADRMVLGATTRQRNNFASIQPRGKTSIMEDSQKGANRFAKIPQGSAAKFDAQEVGGIEVIAAPNLKTSWVSRSEAKRNGSDKSKGMGRSSSANSRGKSDSGLNQDEDSISMGNGKSLARGESAEHDNEQSDIAVELTLAPRNAQARVSSYNARIDRGNQKNGQRNSNNASDSLINHSKSELFTTFSTNDKNDNSRPAGKNDTKFGEVSENGGSATRINNVTAELVKKVVNLTASNHWRSLDGKKPRIVKAIYRRKPINGGVIKNSRESSQSNNSSDVQASSHSL